MRTPEFAKHLEVKGCSFTVQDLRDLAQLLEQEVGPPDDRAFGQRIHVRGREWDFSCQRAEELSEQAFPQTIHSMAFSLDSAGRHMTLRLDTGMFLLVSSTGCASLDVTGDDRNWVSGAFEKVQSRLGRCRAVWRWMHSSAGSIVIWMALWVLWSLGVVQLAVAVSGKPPSTLVLASYPFALLLLSTSALSYLYPAVEFQTSPADSRRNLRALAVFVVGGLVVNALYALISGLHQR